MSPQEIRETDEERTLDAGHYAVMRASLQARRLRDAVRAVDAAQEDTMLRAYAAAEPSLRKPRPGHPRPLPTLVATRELSMRVPIERDQLFDAVRAVLRALKVVPDELRPAGLPAQGDKIYKHLRDAKQHFDAPGGSKAAQTLAEAFPHVELDKTHYSMNEDEVWFGADRTLPLTDIESWLDECRSAFSAAIEELTGRAMEPLDSCLYSEDAKSPWPSQRQADPDQIIETVRAAGEVPPEVRGFPRPFGIVQYGARPDPEPT